MDGDADRLAQRLPERLAMPVTLRPSQEVETCTRAFCLHERLGFSRVGEMGIYVQMVWQPHGSGRGGDE